MQTRECHSEDQDEKDSFVWKMFLNEVQNRQKQVLEVSVKKREEEWRRQIDVQLTWRRHHKWTICQTQA